MEDSIRPSSSFKAPLTTSGSSASASAGAAKMPEAWAVPPGSRMTSHETACRPDLLGNVFIVNVNSVSERGANNRNGDQKGEQKVVHGRLRDWFIGPGHPIYFYLYSTTQLPRVQKLGKPCRWHRSTTSPKLSQFQELSIRLPFAALSLRNNVADIRHFCTGQKQDNESMLWDSSPRTWYRA